MQWLRADIPRPIIVRRAQARKDTASLEGDAESARAQCAAETTEIVAIPAAQAVRVLDTVTKTWRHLDFFQHLVFLHARVARIDRPDCGVRLVTVPWARPGSGLYAPVRGLRMTARSSPCCSPLRSAASANDTRLWRVVQR
jgi:hypothetical protein